ncbi:restriction endonuclease subunit S [Ferrimicrobium acidiphilum]|uniref:restriction endonuclease subunit S n=1 Tax=Ferrimicrobium acidiphilum TaxID=121039 RepID=UPI0023F1ADD3|nr:restriction endonuclease subunit S [Ferrimicrobium acidiphilum]
MITTGSLPQLLDQLDFSKGSLTRTLNIDNGVTVTVNIVDKRIEYPESIKVNANQVLNFEHNENFVVLECVVRLLSKGYKPEHIELEPRWQVGHGGSGGRADILVYDQLKKPLLLIECKTAGSEFNKEWRNTLSGTGQLFSYAQQISDVLYLCLYASDLGDSRPTYSNYIIAHVDNEQYLIDNPTLARFKDAGSVDERYRVWVATYKTGYTEVGIFEDDIQPYEIGKQTVTIKDLRLLSELGAQGSKYNEFATILRQHNISGRENAFDKLVNLLLCKLVDEINNPNDLKFRWKGVAYDTHFDIMDRIQLLYHEGMKSFLGEDITYINRVDVANSMRFIRHNPDATQRAVWNLFVQQKFFTNNDFSFIDVHNERLFYQNIEVLLKVVEMWQGVKLTSSTSSEQFLGDMFENFLDQGIKQSEGQYFTPIPICRFMLMSLPLEELYSQPEVPMGIDYACGAGHFLTELAQQASTVQQHGINVDKEKMHSSLYGIEKEYRLSKIAKVASFMHNQGAINIVHGDALVNNHDRAREIKDGVFDILVSNPPYSVRGFLETLPEEDRSVYELSALVNDISSANGIETYFIERAKQLLKADGVCALILPISVLTTGSNVYIKAREILLGYFHIFSIVELGSGTFGKTGTSTIAIFIRRRQTEPEDMSHWRERVDEWFAGCENDKRLQVLYKDEAVLESYAAHLGVEFEDYKSLLRNEPEGTWCRSEYFKSAYEMSFDNSTVWRRRQKKRDYGQSPTEDQQIKKRTTYLRWVREIERDKLLYFALVSQQTAPVVIVRAPESTKEVQTVLGYTWSTRKGDEGIKLITDSDGNHVTPMYNPSDRNDPNKYAYHIAANFNGSLDEAQASAIEHLQVANLIDMLNFRSASFDKAISLSPATTQRTLKWQPGVAVKPLGEVVEIVAGQSPKGEFYNRLEEGLPFYQGTKRFRNGRLGQPELWTRESPKQAKKGDVLFGVRAPVGTVSMCDQDEVAIGRGVAALRCKTESVKSEYLLQLILLYPELARGTKGAGFEQITIDKLKAIDIPVPLLDVQKRLIDKCTKIDEEVSKAEEVVAGGGARTKLAIDRHINFTTPVMSLDQVAEIKYGKSLIEGRRQSSGGVPVVGSAGVVGYHNIALTSGATIVIGRKGSAGTLTYLPVACFPIDTTFYIDEIRAGIEIDLQYLYLSLVARENELKQERGGTGVPGLGITVLQDFNIPVPSMDVQKKIINECTKIAEEVDKAEEIITGCGERKRGVFQTILELL